MYEIRDHNDFKSSLKLLRIPHSEVNNNFYVYKIEEVKEKDKSVHTPFFRQNYMDVSLFLSAGFDFKYAHLDFPISNKTLQICAPRQAQQISVDHKVIGIMSGYTLYFKQEFLEFNFEHKKFLKEFPFFAYNSLNNVFELSTQETLYLKDLYDRLLYEQNSGCYNYHQNVAYGYIIALLYKIKSLWEKQLSQREVIPISSETQLVTSFDNLITTHLGTLYKVRDFAEMLHVSQKHLSDVLKRQTGKTAKQLIDEVVTLEAKTLLKRTKHSVAEVAYRLGFEDSSHFTKFFQRITGYSPSNYRQLP
ncbi:AraC family transcriptional regulator [Ulvibacterium sp.]|uniref:helix-turn-helix domain-containing protein n=1 Tax=Ulvibacterium sp. TaxID=2665914 RepID=UPI00262893A4|nr:helix-turn-helix domain-containing protein [Ulvibacterium sp.]